MHARGDCAQSRTSVKKVPSAAAPRARPGPSLPFDASVSSALVPSLPSSPPKGGSLLRARARSRAARVPPRSSESEAASRPLRRYTHVCGHTQRPTHLSTLLPAPSPPLLSSPRGCAAAASASCCAAAPLLSCGCPCAWALASFRACARASSVFRVDAIATTTFSSSSAATESSAACAAAPPFPAWAGEACVRAVARVRVHAKVRQEVGKRGASGARFRTGACGAQAVCALAHTLVARLAFALGCVGVNVERL